MPYPLDNPKRPKSGSENQVVGFILGELLSAVACAVAQLRVACGNKATVIVARRGERACVSHLAIIRGVERMLECVKMKSRRVCWSEEFC